MNFTVDGNSMQSLLLALVADHCMPELRPNMAASVGTELSLRQQLTRHEDSLLATLGAAQGTVFSATSPILSFPVMLDHGAIAENVHKVSDTLASETTRAREHQNACEDLGGIEERFGQLLTRASFLYSAAHNIEKMHHVQHRDPCFESPLLSTLSTAVLWFGPLQNHNCTYHES